MKTKSMLILLFYALLLINALLMSKVVVMVQDHYEAFDRNPFLFGADKYMIKECNCERDSGNLLYFNKTTMMQYSPQTAEINYTRVKEIMENLTS